MLKYVRLLIIISSVLFFESLNATNNESYLHKDSKTLFAGKTYAKSKIVQEGFIYGSFNIPISSTTANGSMGFGYGIAFDGTTYINTNIGIVTHFSATYQSTNIDLLKGGTLMYWILPGVKYVHDLVEGRYKKDMSIEGEALVGVGLFKTIGGLAEAGSSGSLGFGLGLGFSYDSYRITFKYLYCHPKFEYTKELVDYISSMKASYLQIGLGYTFDFLPKRKPK